MAACEASDHAIEYRASIGCTCGPPEMINARALNEGIITAEISSRRMHPKHRIAIQQRRSNAFLKRISTVASRGFIYDPMAATFSKRSTMDRSIVIVYHFDRTITPKMCINRGVLRCSKHSSWKSKLLICLDTFPLESLDPIVFYTHFRTSGAFEIEIWLSRLREIDA